MTAAAVLTGGPRPAFAAEPLQRPGRTVVRHEDENVQAVLSWRYADRAFRNERWILLELVLAAKDRPVSLRRDTVVLVMPDGTRLPLPSQERFSREVREPLVLLKRASYARDPLDGFYHQPMTDGNRDGAPLSFFAISTQALATDAVTARKTHPVRGDLFLEAPSGTWPEGRYALALASIGVELPFTLPANDPKKETKGPDGETVTW